KAKRNEGQDGDGRNEKHHGEEARLAEIVQPLHAERDIRPDRHQHSRPEGERPALAGAASVLGQRETIEQECLDDRQKQTCQEVRGPADAAGEAEEQPDEFVFFGQGTVSERQSRSNSLMEVLERVWASTRFTMTAQ